MHDNVKDKQIPGVHKKADENEILQAR